MELTGFSEKGGRRFAGAPAGRGEIKDDPDKVKTHARDGVNSHPSRRFEPSGGLEEA